MANEEEQIFRLSTPTWDDEQCNGESNDGLTVTSIQLAYATLEVIVSIVSTFGNALIVVAFLRDRQLRTPINLYVFSLAIADLFVSIFAIPIYLYSMITRSPSDYLSCLAVNTWIMMLFTVSIFHLVAVSFDRYMAIVWWRRADSRKREDRMRQAYLAITLAWICGTVIGFLPIMGWNRGPSEGKRCDFMEIMDLRYLLFLFYFTIITPTFVMAFFYVSIFNVVRRQDRRMAARLAGSRLQVQADDRYGHADLRLRIESQAGDQKSQSDNRKPQLDHQEVLFDHPEAQFDHQKSQFDQQKSHRDHRESCPDHRPRYESESSQRPKSRHCLQNRYDSAYGSSSEQRSRSGDEPSQSTEQSRSTIKSSIYRPLQESMKKRGAKSSRVIISFLLVIVSFLTSWYPLYILNTITYYAPQYQIDQSVFYICIVLSHLSPAVNPLIYARTMPGFKKALLDTMYCEKLVGRGPNRRQSTLSLLTRTVKTNGDT